MTYRVEVADRALRDLDAIYREIQAETGNAARVWFDELVRRVSDLSVYPGRGAVTREDRRLRQVLHGRKPNAYRIIYAIDEQNKTVAVLHVRHARRDGFEPAA